jgi:C-terminal processing protease CtpA/Prc
VVPDSPADQIALKLAPGDRVLAVDGRPVAPDTDPAEVLNGPETRNIELTVRSGDQTPGRSRCRPPRTARSETSLRRRLFEAVRARVRAAAVDGSATSTSSACAGMTITG